jgi:hypothetical protein
MIDPQVAFDKLNGFQTPKELADYFKSEGIKGYKASHVDCPIASWMTKTIGMRTSVAGYVVVLDARSNFFVKTPPVLTKFMTIFDRGDFPELLK